jgi:hypothetical protein
MFARRRRPTDEDEPLVPHGLVWQATDDQPEAAAAKPIGENPPPSVSRATSPEPLTLVATPSTVIPLPKREDAIPPASNVPRTELRAVDLITKKPSASTNTARDSVHQFHESARRFLSEAIPDSRKHLAEVVELAAQRRNEAARGLRRHSASVLQFCSRLADAAGREEARFRAWLKTQELAAKRDHALSTGKNAGQRASATLRISGQRLWARAEPRWDAAKLALTDRWERFSATRVRIRVARPSLSLPWNRVDLGARVRDLRPHGRILLARLRAEWILRKQHLERDSRAWTSMAMAAVCALLIVGFVSGVRHYAAGDLPSRQFTSETSAGASSAAAASRAGVAVEPTPQTSTPQTSTAQSSTPQEPSTVPSRDAKARVARSGGSKTRMTQSAHSKPRRTVRADDDYVAKDTYVYYGSQPARKAQTATRRP